MKIVKTKSGKYWPAWEPTGQLVREGAPHGHESIESAQKKASEVLRREKNVSVSPERIKIGNSCD